MNSLVFVAALAFIACTSAGVVLPSATIIQGPSSRSTLVGPDGSLIDSISTGSQNINSAVIAGAAPLALSAPLLTRASLAAPIAAPIAYSSPLAYSAPLLSSGVVAQNSLNTLVAGPSGSISTSKTLAGPAVVAAPSLYAAPGYYL